MRTQNRVSCTVSLYVPPGSVVARAPHSLSSRMVQNTTKCWTASRRQHLQALVFRNSVRSTGVVVAVSFCADSAKIGRHLACPSNFLDFKPESKVVVDFCCFLHARANKTGGVALTSNCGKSVANTTVEMFFVVASCSRHSMNVCLTASLCRWQARACAAIVYWVLQPKYGKEVSY